MKVFKCICHCYTFAEIKERLDAGENLETIVKDTKVGMKCGMCQPYIEKTVETGEVTHDIIR